MRLLLSVLIQLSIVVPAISTATDPQAEDRALGEHLAALLRAGRAVISSHQSLIDDPTLGDKGIDGNSIVAEATALYTERLGSPPVDEKTAEPEKHLIEALMDSMREVVNEHEREIDTPGIGFKGFIPAIFGRLVGERFAAKVGTIALIKVTAPMELVRNRKALPDDWELKVIRGRFLDPAWPKGESYTEETTVGGRKAFRMLIPEYYVASCLACHGRPAGALDVTGYPKEGGAEGDLGGAISVVLFR